MLHAVIMAGGSGTRFWPASRTLRPKQLLDLAGEESMIQATVSRLDKLVTADRVLVVTNRRLVEPIRQQLQDLPPASVLGEPCKRDTAPCVGLAAAWVSRNDPDAIMAVMPADHVIQSHSAFHAAIEQAAAHGRGDAYAVGHVWYQTDLPRRIVWLHRTQRTVGQSGRISRQAVS